MLMMIECPDEWCDQAAEITDRYILPSTGGEVAHVVTVCVLGHRFNMPDPT